MGRGIAFTLYCKDRLPFYDGSNECNSRLTEPTGKAVPLSKLLLNSSALHVSIKHVATPSIRTVSTGYAGSPTRTRACTKRFPL